MTQVRTIVEQALNSFCNATDLMADMVPQKKQNNLGPKPQSYATMNSDKHLEVQYCQNL